jgi:hypothetical protein
VAVARRTVLGAGLGVLLGGCAEQATPPRPQSRATPAPSPVAPGTPAAGTLPAVQAWHPPPGDLVPDCKRAAVRAVETAGVGPGHTLQVIDVQYGGLLSDSASVLVVTRSWSLRAGTVRTGGHTFDVRMSRHGSRWQVDAIHPSRPGPPAPLSDLARGVLHQDRIDLPPAARRDVQSGRVHDSVLAALLSLAGTYRIGISVLRSGHPLHVFGTTRLSDHPQGRAFDTWTVDGHAVVDPHTSRQLVVEYMQAVAATGSDNVGGPYLLGRPPQWFSDATHHDHVHAGFAS